MTEDEINRWAKIASLGLTASIILGVAFGLYFRMQAPDRCAERWSPRETRFVEGWDAVCLVKIDGQWWPERNARLRP